jgi:hypothetical protein
MQALIDRYSRFAPFCIILILGTIGVIWPAILNHYPFIFPDTSDYIILTPRVYRSPFYQLWVFLTGWKISLWPIIISQSLLTTWLILIFLKAESNGSIFLRGIGILPIIFCSSLPIVSSFIMPDVFTGMMFLSIYLLIFKWRVLEKQKRVAIFFLSLISISAHLSHLMMAIAISVASAVFLFVFDRHRFSAAGLIASLVSCITCASFALIFNLVVFDETSINPAGTTFLMANLIAQGPARAELKATCPEAKYRLCMYRDRLPISADDFLWGNGLLVHLGGFEKMGDESTRLVLATLAHRPLEVISASLASTARAMLTLNPTAEITPSAPFVIDNLGLVYGIHEVSLYKNGRQEQQIFPKSLVNFLIFGGLFISFMLIIFFGFRSKGNGLTFVSFVIVSYMGNALMCGTLSGVHDRYQSRISWLFVLAAVALTIGRRRRADQT